VLTGYPIVQYEYINNDKTRTVWLSKEMINNLKEDSYKPTTRSRMSYAIPEFIQGNYENKPVILNLDDFSRGSSLLMNAIMNIVEEQRYMTWNLPQGSTVILSSNPDNGSYNISNLDLAASDRYITLTMKSSVSDWAAWATGVIPDKFIDFLQQHKEVIENSSEGTKEMGSLRGWTRYFQTIEGISNLETDWYRLALPLSGNLPSEHVILFHKFIQEKLDQLPTSVEILQSQDIEKKIDELKLLTKNRKDITALITKRLYNHIVKFSKQLTKLEIDNYTKLLENDTLLTKDLVFIYIRNLAQPEFASIFNVTKNPILVKKIIS
jgi:ribonucleotide reductase beta subunit family protein with ferritin-like domain